ncbi:MAG: alpha/beta fold hydrolase, partial [Acidimicrobiales bacterium]
MTQLTEERLSTADGKVVVLRGGQGRPLVYLHSATGEGAGTPLLDQLAEDFSVSAPLFPGFGDSEGIDSISDIEDAAFHVLDLLDVLGVGPAPVLVGLSLGGWLAAEVATRWPERVGSLVLVNPAGLHIEGAPIAEIFGRDPGELAEDLFADQSHPMAQVMHQMAELMANGADIPFELVKPVLQSLAATAKVGWDPYLHNPRLRRRLPRISSPTLVVHGVSDRLIPRAHAEVYAAEIPAARLVEVEGAGHLLSLERPEELARLVREEA